MSLLQPSVFDIECMSRALQLARQGLYTTHPNPRVGCVLAADGQLVAEGWHQRAGEGHAEVNALAAAGDSAQGATAYVTLEPCSHVGRTGPCCEALVKAGVSRVWIAMQDPNPQVSGRGMERLRAAGIEVVCGLLESQARALNPGFIKRMEQGQPFVRCKLAMSLDGRTAMASGESQWITGADARGDVQRLRARSSAIVSGVESILQDDASLTVRPDELGLENAREICRRQPLRVVLDSQLRTPPKAKVLQGEGATLLVCTLAADRQRRAALEAAGAEVICLAADDGRLDLKALMEELARRECNELLLETGATLAGSALSAGIIDELVVYMAPVLMGSEARPLLSLPIASMSNSQPLSITDVRAVGRDWRITATPTGLAKE
ncbi:bifunctional diaminohydroxyphosphoribosylaminopyrimidine deaminase/5-amino-6-(5-phosphoribosylamino)uracil reductase RibD [Aestuariirhabdus sp. Z084]|uniref:bifunctional diaminohydroxyphosphoribosylaminopyrimidine deaminase/5-amino-6-(5-phosphoribosylamino)uracil reductase RibD n=1 Tax=Aestuariirhabdus haliotis TaxID=2918751 RepID=UPI00201B3B94|nr:bifunctional diaminohydroxyphosphoribosylaminopyrimidine deaminase/5-amino-6-(5-phosphoribosylamino)uracil reductase RibD [Aestuariirhabdus haliotis]MCL6415064.1 bifunctional diaminohydroxyphosphoribosylaminopyrimidine deaminase/5-amino-6-(5-phosphoribosylamino)uracil reductase RibD [Aestuariirhabdus haliotis]MCL6418996.1 bifunctional diaminohydroxyphosphoribosylaminopyrimidine deaminase/5-amino-6-(5-phosphoribosylamino)uracil reductase RibD [Aestuariirhabdus haliotis]